MILNERQHRIAKTAEGRIAKQIEDFERKGVGDLAPKQRELLLHGARQQLSEIRHEIEEFDALRKGAIPIAPIGSIDQLPLALIRARIARGWTQARLAGELDVAEQQVQRDEANRYKGANVEKLSRIAEVLGVRVGGVASIDPPQQLRPIDARWRKPLLVMLLHAVGQIHGRAVEGRLELQKLVIVMEERLRSKLDFSAFHFEPYMLGGYDFEIDDDLDFLEHHGFAEVEVLAKARGRADPTQETREPVRIQLASKGASWLEGFLKSSRLADPARKKAVYDLVAGIATEYGALGARALVEHTYEHHEELSGRSMIREDVERRIARKRKGK